MKSKIIIITITAILTACLTVYTVFAIQDFKKSIYEEGFKAGAESIELKIK